MSYYRSEVFKREDGDWDWRLVAPNGQIVSTSGTQGYTEKNDAQEAVNKLIAIIATEGAFASAEGATSLDIALTPANLEAVDKTWEADRAKKLEKAADLDSDEVEGKG